MTDTVPHKLNFQLEEFLKNLGLSADESLVYQALVKQGVTSTLKLAQATALPRTNVYRILESLKKIGIVEEVIDEKRKLAKAADPSRLEFLLNEQKEKTKTLESLFPDVQTLLKQQVGGQQPGTEVLFYRGKEGLWQQIFNELRARDEIIGYTLLSFEDIAGKKFAQKYREERLIRNIRSREILADNDKYLTSETLKYVKQSALFRNYQARYLPRQKININHNLIIYNNVVSFINWYEGSRPDRREGEIFGLEIYNQNIANMQKQIFNLLWEIAEKPEKTLNRKKSRN